ncbi:class I SAM-dependent methyltransferase [Acidisoma cellulosilytica]|uniref:Class I SAM-dependent methyltransferase n=1 Tax=Acidisoma cellulosilyticum TaxID=2802395 RepID=A0A963Z077_9PROT|nr:class I SAM-dependent methyltransferase [Acidisoma cellulosilyticum]MCB8879443.1 class I SAM-dependent methyltransferase [Acidisoma cellulosilyticum]
MVKSACKICGKDARFFASVDSSQHCNMQLDPAWPKTGVAVSYFRCESCGFLFSTYLDDYTKDDLCRLIYNDDYVKFDPLYPRIRPEINARFVGKIVSEAWTGDSLARVLDYGAGSGLLSQILQPDIAVDNFDAMNPAFDRLPASKYDFIFCAEVVEHIPFPESFVKDWTALLSDGGVVVFSTKTLPEDIDSQKGDWWYLGPRNGHVSLYSGESLGLLLGQAGLRYESLTDDWHVAVSGDRPALDLQIVRRLVDMQPKGFILI